MESTGGNSSNDEDTGQLELVEEAMRKLAAQREPDIPLLARLDRLRNAVLQGLKRAPRRGAHDSQKAA
jgi:hypothetical protein